MDTRARRSSSDVPLLSPTWVADPFAQYRRLRESTPAFVDGRWLVMRHEDVMRAVVDTATFSSDHAHSPNPALRDTPIIFEDPPEHTKHRRLINKAFTPNRVNEMEGWVAATAGRLFDELGDGPVEIVSGFCDSLPVLAIARLMGVEVDDHATLKRWSDQRSYLIGTEGAGVSTRPDVANAIATAREANQSMIDYFERAAAERRSQPRGDLITALVTAEVDGETLTDVQISGICALLLTAGNVTTTNLLANMLNLLAHRPDWYAWLRQERSLVPAVVEEVLRIESPVQWMGRVTTREVELNGVAIPADAPVLLFYGAANHDPGAFVDPEVFEPQTSPRSHLAFGHGIHFCLGAPLARMEARVGVEALLDRYSRIAPGDAPSARIGTATTHCGFARLPLVLHP